MQYISTSLLKSDLIIEYIKFFTENKDVLHPKKIPIIVSLFDKIPLDSLV